MQDFEKVYTLSDLKNWTRQAPSFAVLGKPIAHSLSPVMHNAAFAAESAQVSELSARRYFRFEISPEELTDALPLFLEKNFFGLNLTIPHKVAVIPFLAEISEEAKIIGAANTLMRNDALGGWVGENTDGRGFARAVKQLLGRELAGTPVVLLGAGGAARAIAATALSAGCASLSILNRTRERAEALAADLKAHFGEQISEKLFLCPESIPENALIANATALGLKPDDASPIAPNALKSGMAVYDTTYGSHISALVAAAREREIPAADGRAMLAWQGALAFELWNNVPAERVFPVMFEKLIAGATKN